MDSLRFREVNTVNFSRIEKFIVLSLVLYTMNFLNRGAYIPFLLVPFVLIKLVKKRYIFTKVIFTAIFIFIFGLFYAYFQITYGFTESIIINLSYIITPSIMYLLGYLLINKDGTYKKTYTMLYSVIYGTFLFAVLSTLKTISIYGSLDLAFSSQGVRYIISFWGDNSITVTGLNTYLALSAAMLPTILFNYDTGNNIKMKKRMIFIASIISLYIILQIGSRTGILIIMVSFFMSLLLTNTNFLKLNYSFKSTIIIYIYFIIVLFILLFIGYYMNIFEIRDILSNSLTIQRLTNTSAQNDPRFIVWKEALIGVFKNPLGGRNTNLSLNYAHNLWLDVGYDAGILPLILLIIVTVTGFLSIITFMKTRYTNHLKSTVISSFTVFFIIFLMEPVMQGWFYFFAIFCLLLGIVHKLLILESKQL